MTAEETGRESAKLIIAGAEEVMRLTDRGEWMRRVGVEPGTPRPPVMESAAVPAHWSADGEPIESNPLLVQQFAEAAVSTMPGMQAVHTSGYLAVDTTIAATPAPERCAQPCSEDCKANGCKNVRRDPTIQMNAVMDEMPTMGFTNLVPPPAPMALDDKPMAGGFCDPNDKTCESCQ
jgi:hypothetical protein